MQLWEQWKFQFEIALLIASIIAAFGGLWPPATEATLRTAATSEYVELFDRFLSSGSGRASLQKEQQMKRVTTLPAMAALLTLALAATVPMFAQDRPAAGTTTASSAAPNEVAQGTRFLVGLDNVLSTKDSKAGDAFTVRTLVPLVAADGTGLPAGTEVRGHVDKVEAAGKTGRARMWLAFDDIKTPDGWMPLIAMVDDVPGVHSIRVNYNREGEIEASTVKRQEALQAAAAGALVGATPGMVSKNEKEAAMGAAAAAAAAYMVAAGLGQEVTLEKSTKLELILERSLLFPRT
jgi:hypothetical protein